MHIIIRVSNSKIPAIVIEFWFCFYVGLGITSLLVVCGQFRVCHAAGLSRRPCRYILYTSHRQIRDPLPTAGVPWPVGGVPRTRLFNWNYLFKMSRRVYIKSDTAAGCCCWVAVFGVGKTGCAITPLKTFRIAVKVYKYYFVGILFRLRASAPISETHTPARGRAFRSPATQNPFVRGRIRLFRLCKLSLWHGRRIHEITHANTSVIITLRVPITLCLCIVS